jgi:hypothetical protein
VNQTISQHRTGFLASSGGETAYVNGETGTPQERVEAVHENLNPKSEKQEVDVPEAEIPEEEVPEEKIPEASQVKGQQKEKEDLERRAIGKVGAEKREAYKLKLAMPSRLYYRLFEECCVHGMMNGEAIALQNTMLDKGQMLPKVFDLMI